MLPVFSVGDAEEAKSLLVLACSTNYKGEYVAKELVHEQSIDNLESFGERLKSIHDEHLVPRKDCRCKKKGAK